jgi:hypothetical protein
MRQPDESSVDLDCVTSFRFNSFMRAKTLFPIVFVLFLLCLLSFPTAADVLILRNGTVLTGTVLQEDGNGVLIKLDYGTFTYPKSNIKDVQRSPEGTNALQLEVSEPGRRIPSWGKIIFALSKKKWCSELKQIPATVIDVGVMKNVPYASFQCRAGGYEMNIYGDLDAPAGVEIGVKTFLLKNDEAKSNCVEFVQSILPNDQDKQIVYRLDRSKDIRTREGMTFEITPPTDPDSYDGWWVSVYDEAGLTTGRASEPELKTITQPIVAQSAPWPVAPPPRATGTANTPTTTWSGSDMRYARPSTNSSGGSVYVKGYYRKDGTYVQGYTRRK